MKRKDCLCDSPVLFNKEAKETYCTKCEGRVKIKDLRKKKYGWCDTCIADEWHPDKPPGKYKEEQDGKHK